jgi:hypothetical protein
MARLVVGATQEAPEHIRLAIIAINTTFQAPTVWAAIGPFEKPLAATRSDLIRFRG